MVIVLHFDVRDIREIEDNRENDDHDADRGVRDPKILAAGALAGCVLGIEKHPTRDRPEKQANAVA